MLAPYEAKGKSSDNRENCELRENTKLRDFAYM